MNPLIKLFKRAKKELDLDFICFINPLWKDKDKEELRIFLDNDEYWENINLECFFYFLSYSRDAIDFLLGDPSLKRRLNKLPAESSKQKCENSCMAYCIMSSLVEMKVLTPAEATISKELEIYKSIWLRPGGISDPRKAIDYFLINFPSIRLSRLMIEPFASKNLTDIRQQSKSFERITRDRAKLTLESYKEFIQDPRIALKTSHASTFFGKQEFVKDNSILLFVLQKLGHMHFITGRVKTNSFEILYSEKGERTLYKNLSEFLQHQEYFSGIGYLLEKSSSIKSYRYVIDDEIQTLNYYEDDEENTSREEVSHLGHP